MIRLVKELNSISNQRVVIAKILLMTKQEDSEQEVVERLAKSCLPVDLSCNADYSLYEGLEVEPIDEPLSTDDLREVLKYLMSPRPGQYLKSNSA